MLNLKKLCESFYNAFRGLKVAFSENTFQILLFSGIVTLTLAVHFPLEAWEVVVITILTGLVISVELINSQIERILDILEPDYDKRVKNIKDISAGAVLVISITAFLVGVSIFLPYLLT